jgi:hypothetical protein
LARARAGGRAFGPLGPATRGDDGGRRRGAGPTRQGEGVADSVDSNRGRGGSSTGVRSVASPAAVLRRWSGSTVGRWWRSTGGGGGWGGRGGGRILPAGTYGGRSAARWRVPAAVMPPVRLPTTIEGERWRPVTVRVWRSFWHSSIEQRIARGGKGSSPER